MWRIRQGVFICGLVLFILISGCATFPEHEKQKITIYWPPPPQEPKIAFVDSVALPSDMGIEKAWFSRMMDSLLGRDEGMDLPVRPHGVFAGAGDRLLVTDPGAGVVHIFDRRNNDHITFSRTDQDTALISPIGVVEDTAGNIYVSDSVRGRIFVFGRTGDYLTSFGEGLKRPTGLAIHPEGGRLFVADTLAARISVFDLAGKEVGAFGELGTELGQLNAPTHLFLGGSGILYVSDTLNFRVQAFDLQGRFQFAFGQLGDGSGDMVRPKGVAEDSAGHVYVVDAEFETVQIFRRDGTLLLAFGASGKEPGYFNIPAGIFIDKKDSIYVADSYNRRIQIFRYLGDRVVK